MADGGSSRLGVAPSPERVLDLAVARITERLDTDYPLLEPGGTGRAEGYLRTLRSKLLDIIRGGDPEPIRIWLSKSPLYEPLMESLIRQVVADEAGSGESGAAVLTVVRAWLQLGLGPSLAGTTQPPDDDLKARMRGPDAFELLVEVAHDFRSPLTSILFLAEALRDGHSGSVNDVQRSQLGLIYSAAFGLASIASDIMDLAREEKDLIGGEGESFSLSELFQTVERMVRPIVEEKGLELRVGAPERWQTRGHPRALTRVLLNLTTNALKFTDEGWVELGVRPLPHRRLEYYVQDTGRGISPEQQRALFQPFRRRSVKSTDGHHFSGSGIGLSIARRLLRAMNSDLVLDSSDQQGTRFSFVLLA